FNLLGPLTNPASATHQIMGIYSRDMVEPMVRVLRNLGARRALVVHGSDGLDEITTTGVTFLSVLDGDSIIACEIKPEEFGIPRAQESDLKGGDAAANAIITRDILKGVKGPKRDIVLLNAAFALYAAEKAGSPKEGLLLATEALDSGKAMAKLDALKEFTHREP
ncbi:MAG: anthranilate phosphoribosyltransferase, partial [Candidatus Omnitrophica bacterium]|nr:anthranilate phosphoribosyltransferase [Candidatus Omnitrophota bacterium]